MKKTPKNPRLIFSITLISIIVICITSLSVDTQNPIIEFQTNNSYDTTLVVAADKDFDPYSFYDEMGNPTGHDIEMIYLLANAMKMNVEIRLMNWNEAIEAMKSKEVDALLGLVYTPQGLQNFQLSIPVSNDSFIVFGKENYSGLNDLYDKKLAILKGSDIYNLFLRPYTLDKNTTVYNTYGEAFDSVVKGYNDYAIATYSVGKRYSAQYPDITPVGEALMSNSFCIAVAADNLDLVNKINKAILEKKYDGVLDAVSKKWLGEYVEIIGIGDFIKQHTLFFTLLLSVIVLVPLLSLLYVYRKRSIILKHNEHMLLERASRDFLTKVLNRSVTENMINQIISDGKEADAQHALFMLDLDNFKIINDTHGHVFGDQVLIMLANHIKTVFRDDDVIARMGGDEFLIFMKECKNTSILEQKVAKLCTDLDKERTIQNIPIHVSVSVGISLCPRDGDDFATLYKKADEALYVAKEKGKNQFIVYTPE